MLVKQIQMPLGKRYKKRVIDLAYECKAITRLVPISSSWFSNFVYLQPRRQRTTLQRSTYQIVDRVVVAKAHFGFRGMNVYVNLRGMEFKEEKHHPTFTLECIAHSTIESAVPHWSAIDKKIIPSPPDFCG